MTSIENSAFSGCSSLTSITIPNNVTSIGNYAFSYCSSLASINIPDGVASIEGHTFDGCSSITSITIPDSVTSIGDAAFYGCSSLTRVTMSKNTKIGYDLFKFCSPNLIISYYENEKYKSSKKTEDFYKWYSSYSNVFANRATGEIFFGSGMIPYLEYIAKKAKNTKGIKSFFSFTSVNEFGNTRFYFSTDGNLYELRNLLAYSWKDMEVYDIDQDKVLNNNYAISIKEFISMSVIARDQFGIVSQIKQGKHVTVLQFEYYPSIISKEEVIDILRDIFYEYFEKDFGPVEL